MALLNGLPVFKITFNEDLSDKSGMGFISTVDYPAIEQNWIAMGDNKAPMKFSSEPDKQMLYGPILIAGQPIYRYDEKTKTEYYVVFTKEVIEKLVRKFQLQQKTINLNYQHLADSQIKDAVIQEIWLTAKVDKSQTLGFDLPEGSAFIAAHIGNKEFWDNEIKTGNVKGFSIEGFLDMEMKRMKSPSKFTEAKVKNDNSIFIDGEIAVGSNVYYNTPTTVLINGQKSELKNLVWESNITLQDGTVLIIANGQIVEIPNKTNMSNQKFITAKTDKGLEIMCDGETWAKDHEVYTMTDNVKTPVADGDHLLENGTTLKVAAGKIVEVIEAEEELSEGEIAVIQRAVKPLIDAYEQKIKDLETKLSNMPGAKSKTDKTDEIKVTLSDKQKLLQRFAILKKKNSEINTQK